jgi:gamma-glutamylcysteine synthetase
MYYICIENNEVISVLSYRPSVPPAVSVEEISNDDFRKLEESTHYYDVTTKTVKEKAAEMTNSTIKSAQNREFLNSTDWQVLRHIREQALGKPTTLSQAEYMELERKRDLAAQGQLI